MKFLLAALLGLFTLQAFSQFDSKGKEEWDASYFYGTILEHNPDIGHLITRHPAGFMLSYSRKTYGIQKWSSRYNYPDHGFTFLYQDMKNPILGKNFSVYGHFNFYFFNRHLVARIGQGIAYNTNPYDPETNHHNNAYGTHILSSTLVQGNYVYKDLINGLGLQAGVTLIHYSNANVDAPNNSTNSFTLNLGVNYLLDSEHKPAFIPRGEKEKYSGPIHYNFALRAGVNASDVVGMGQYPLLTMAAYADKKINHKSTFQAGLEVFFSPMQKELIRYESIAYPERGVSGDEASTRLGFFVGHLLTFNKTSFLANLGYYLYYPYDFEGRVYNRLGIQRELSDHYFVSISVHAHGAKAENAAFSIGYRL